MAVPAAAGGRALASSGTAAGLVAVRLRRLGCGEDVPGCRVDQAGEQEPSVRGAEERIHGMLRVGHETHDVSGLVRHPGHAAERAVHVLRVAEGDLAPRDELHELTALGKPGTLAVLDGDHELLADLAPAGERRVRGLDPERHLAAHELELAIRAQYAGEQLGLTQNL